MFASFEVMEAQQRDRITAELRTLENQLRAKGANTEVIALALANYFAENQLWSDALQQAYSVQQPSSELQQIRQDIPNQLCNAGSIKEVNDPWCYEAPQLSDPYTFKHHKLLSPSGRARKSEFDTQVSTPVALS